MKRISMLSLAAPFLLWLIWVLGFRINVTPSLAYGLYRISTQPVLPERLASFCLNSDFSKLARERGYLAVGSCPSGLRPLLKQVMGLPGDVVGFQDGLITLNGQIIAETAVAAKDRHGRPLPPPHLTAGVIPQGQALLLSQHNVSFDSRYFGLVPLDSIQWVEPILTFK